MQPGRFPQYLLRDPVRLEKLLERNGKYHPVEIKRSASPSEEDVKHFGVLDKLKIPAGKGAVVCMYSDLLPLNRNVDIMPVACLG